jgi:hypothetical protein
VIRPILSSSASGNRFLLGSLALGIFILGIVILASSFLSGIGMAVALALGCVALVLAIGIFILHPLLAVTSAFGINATRSAFYATGWCRLHISRLLTFSTEGSGAPYQPVGQSSSFWARISMAWALGLVLFILGSHLVVTSAFGINATRSAFYTTGRCRLHISRLLTFSTEGSGAPYRPVGQSSSFWARGGMALAEGLGFFILGSQTAATSAFGIKATRSAFYTTDRCRLHIFRLLPITTERSVAPYHRAEEFRSSSYWACGGMALAVGLFVLFREFESTFLGVDISAVLGEIHFDSSYVEGGPFLYYPTVR